MSDGLGTQAEAPPHGRHDLELREAQTRLVWPFFFDAKQAQAAADSLVAATVGRREAAWECAKPVAVYCEEVPIHVQRLLFPDCEGECRCAYLRIKDQRINEFFGSHATLVLQRRAVDENLRQVQIKPARGLGIEMFLTTCGVGVLSIAVQPDVADAGHLIDLNYELSRLTAQSPAQIRIPHPYDDPDTWLQIPEKERAAIKPPPPDDAPAAERMGRRGGAVTLRELIDELVRPLSAFGYEEVQPHLALYTVVRTSAKIDLANLDQRQRLGPLLSALAQIEELWHAGALPDKLGISNEILNRRHWAAVGTHGAAHLVADQPSPDPRHPEHPFNSERMSRARDRYFVPYLIAVVQRLVIQRAIRDAGVIVRLPPAEAAGPLRRLREEVLQFGVGGQFSHVSNRHAVDRFYDLSRRALGTPTAWNETQQVISELDSALLGASLADNVSLTAKLGASVADNVSMVAHVQLMVEWIEIFIVSVYLAHLYHMISEPATKWLEYYHYISEASGHCAVATGTFVFAVLGFVGMLLLLKPWKLGRDTHH